MMNSMEFSNFWEGQDSEEFLLPGQLCYKVKNEAVKDKYELLNEISENSGNHLDKTIEPLGDDLFPEWMESKVDLSLWDCFDNFENLADLLDDPNLVTKNGELAFKEIPSQYTQSEIIPISQDISFNAVLKEELATSSVLASPPYSNPNSPEGQVPNVTPPNSPSSIASFQFVEPVVAQPVVRMYDLNDCLSQCELLLTDPVIEDASSSSPPSPVESLVSVGAEHVVIPLEEAEPVASTSRGRKRKADSSVDAEAGASKALPKARKERKRMQNKDAATRYRHKKRQEADVIFAQEEDLLEENTKLKEKVQQIATEVSYLKGLMREMFKARGILK